MFSYAVYLISGDLTSECVCVVQVQGFFYSLRERGSQMRSVQEALETIRLNQRWMEKNLATLEKWL